MTLKVWLFIHFCPVDHIHTSSSWWRFRPFIIKHLLSNHILSKHKIKPILAEHCAHISWQRDNNSFIPYKHLFVYKKRQQVCLIVGKQYNSMIPQILFTLRLLICLLYCTSFVAQSSSLWWTMIWQLTQWCNAPPPGFISSLHKRVYLSRSNQAAVGLVDPFTNIHFHHLISHLLYSVLSP